MEYPVTPVVAESMAVYGARDEVSCYPKFTSRDNIKLAIEGEELLNRFRPRIKALFE